MNGVSPIAKGDLDTFFEGILVSRGYALVTAFGPTLSAVAPLLKNLDKPIPEKIRKGREEQAKHRRSGK